MQAAIKYTVNLRSIAQREFEIIQTISGGKHQSLSLYLPAWIPGSYMIRDFAKNIVSLKATDSHGEELPVSQTDKQTWRVDNAQTDVIVSYRVYANDLSVRSAYIDETFAFFNGTSVFLAVEGMESEAADVVIVQPEDKPLWAIKTSFDKVVNCPLHFNSPSYADLIEHPVLMGDLVSNSFTTHGITFEMVFSGLGHYPIDMDRIIDDVRILCEHHINLFGSAPDISYYPFLTMVTDKGYGGLEHLSSTALMCSKEMLVTPNANDEKTTDYQNFLALCSHEFFHTWHVKRIRPAEFQLPDLRLETITEQLWIYEGITSYYDDFSLKASDLVSTEDYLKTLAKGITRLMRNPGRLEQTVTASSINAWTKFYKQDENAVNAIVNYYNKGALIALIIDLYIRHESDHKHSLQTIMRALWSEYKQNNGGTKIDEIQRLCQQVCNLDLSGFLDKALYTHHELPIEQALALHGVSMFPYAASNGKDMGGKQPKQSVINYFGATYTAQGTGVKIQRVLRDSPAELAGLKANDQLLSVQFEQVCQNTLQATLDAFKTGDDVVLHVLRRGQLYVFELPLTEAPMDSVYLEVTNQVAAEKWLSSPAPYQQRS